MQLQDKTVLITGAARGLGAAMALRLAGRGANIALLDLDEGALADTRQSCRALGVRAESYAANVAREDDVAAAFERAAKGFGQIDVAVANAGILRDAQLVKGKDGQVSSTMSLADWQAVIDVNLTGVFLCGREAAQHMIKQRSGGCIVNISSISRHGNFGQSNYSAAKAGVAALSVVWAKELARHGIRVNAIAPGFVRTEILDSMNPEILDKMAAGIPVGRLGQPDEIAQTVQFIVENDYVNGRVIDVDGGQRL